MGESASTGLQFADRETWTGGFYELAVEIGDRSNERLIAALRKVWGFANVEGPYPERGKEPHVQTVVDAASALGDGEDNYRHLFGVARMPNGHKIACGTALVRETSGPDWLVFYLPMGSLGKAYEVGGFPFDSSSLHEQWREEVDSWLAKLGAYIYLEVQFRLGLIGHEVSGWTYAKEIAEAGVPEERYVGYLWPENGTLHYFPRNRQWTN